jgi:hypothetical protein
MRRLLLVIWFALTSVALFTPAAELGQVDRDLCAFPILGLLFRSPLCKAMVNDSAAWHAALFVVLAVLVLYQWNPARKPHIVVGLVALTLFSLGSEGLQAGFVAGRAFEWSDLLVNQGAVLLGAALALGSQARQPVTGQAAVLQPCRENGSVTP